ncbi:hypothetical protein [Streptomyces sp. NPDC050388]|uniref:hypothetical protein n=1 Tax=Streptomyces sp. NPDC050388 TaxID=3155781 RepID=UPI0034313B1D
MMLPVALLLGALTAVVGPRLLARAPWPDRLTAGLRLTAVASLVPVIPILVAFAPGLRALE